MYKSNQVHQFLLDYRVTVTDTKVIRQHRHTPFSYVNTDWDDMATYHQDISVPVIVAEIPEKEFVAIAEALSEFKDLMKDPETARLLMEARFINRLKKGIY
jgi:hypothetical protein